MTRPIPGVNQPNAMPNEDVPFTSRALRDRLLGFPKRQKYLVGFSGGADSTALLHALHVERNDLQADIEAVHFNHGLQAQSDKWQRHCERFCSTRGIPLDCPALEMSGTTANVECRARALRYQYLEEHIDDRTLYLTAHNADDRAETFVLNALRGSGLDGLASIPEIRALGNGYVARPLLEFSREALKTYLLRKDIDWIEDPSNLDTGMDRNFIRLEVLPLLESRWPAARETLARTASHVRAAGAVLGELLARQARLGEYDELSLPLDVVHGLGAQAAGLILRAWLRRQGAPPLPQSRLEEFLAQTLTAAPGSQCETTWEDWTLRLFRGELRLLPPGDCPDCPQRSWDTLPVLELGPELGTLRLGRDKEKAPTRWAVGPRRPGGKIQIHPGGPNRKLKKVFQEQPIPPWQRRSIPVLYWDEEAVAIGDWLFAPKFRDWVAGSGREFRWDPKHPELQKTRRNCHEALTRPQPA